jgi:hypothetical protein
MTATQLVRLSPSGHYLGDPAKRAGPGTESLIWRAHGNGAGLVIVNAMTAITGLDAIPVDMKVGYQYALELSTTMQVVNSTDALNGFTAYFSLRAKATQVWGGWTNHDGWTPAGGAYPPMSTFIHKFPFMNGVSRADVHRQFWDKAFLVNVTQDCDRIAFFLFGSSGAGTTTQCIESGSFARIVEYVV